MVRPSEAFLNLCEKYISRAQAGFLYVKLLRYMEKKGCAEVNLWDDDVVSHLNSIIDVKKLPLARIHRTGDILTMEVIACEVPQKFESWLSRAGFMVDGYDAVYVQAFREALKYGPDLSYERIPCRMKYAHNGCHSEITFDILFRYDKERKIPVLVNILQ